MDLSDLRISSSLRSRSLSFPSRNASYPLRSISPCPDQPITMTRSLPSALAFIASSTAAFTAWELSGAGMGEHYDIDAFDQPGVEAGKIAAYALMGRAGYEKRRAEIEAATRGEKRVL